jgi:hypothetical protein
MLKTLFFSLLLQLHHGWVDKPAPWVRQVNPQEMVETAQRIAQAQPVTPEARQNAQPGFPGPLWKQAAKVHGVDPVLLYSVALFESGKKRDNNRIGPWPFALHFNQADVSIYALSAKEARFVLAHVTTDNVDIGLGQVNYKATRTRCNVRRICWTPRLT